MDGGDWPNGAADWGWGWGFTMIASTCPVPTSPAAGLGLRLRGWPRNTRKETGGKDEKAAKGAGAGRHSAQQSSQQAKTVAGCSSARATRVPWQAAGRGEERRGASLAYPRAGKTNIGMLLLLPFCCTYWRITGGVCANCLPSAATTGYALRTRQEETTGEAATSRPRPPARPPPARLWLHLQCLHWMPYSAR